MSATFSGNTGLLKAVSLGPSEVTIDLDFVSYGTRTGKDKSGAYLFLPDRSASTIVSTRYRPRITIVAGHLVSVIAMCFVILLCLYLCRLKKYAVILDK